MSARPGSCIIVFFVSILLLSCPGTYGLMDISAEDTTGYVAHAPIVIECIETTPDDPYVVSGYEISNPDGPGIQIREVDYVVITNNYIHDCGTNISAGIQDRIRSGEGDARLAAMDAPFDTGGILVFDAIEVTICGNIVENNDYGIHVWGHRFRAEKVTVSENTVTGSHRSAFIKVSNANSATVADNLVYDNGLSIFMDNDGLEEAFSSGKDYPDGRTQGVLVEGTSNVVIRGNTIVNSCSDGIGVTNGEQDYVENIEIYDNEIVRNSEQGIWIVCARDGEIRNNIVCENRAREDLTGGSSGIYLDGDVMDFRVHGNDISYNDMFGITIYASYGIELFGNDIHHNGDGGICWADTPYREKGYGSTTSLTCNTIHNNRVTALSILSEQIGTIEVDGNDFSKNGGNPLHYEMYDDYDMTTHPEDWAYDGPSCTLLMEDNGFEQELLIGTNTIDGLQVAGSLVFQTGSEHMAQNGLFPVLLLIKSLLPWRWVSKILWF